MARFALLVLCLLLPACARAPALPEIADQTPYGEVRERMIQAGFSPLAVNHRRVDFDERPRPASEWCPADSNKPVCDRYPELMYCTDGMLQRCGWLYRADHGGRYAVVTTRCNNFEASYCFESLRWNDDERELNDYLIEPLGRPASARR
ncbi:hypothetical protein ACO2Q0_03090 [Phenylobacterium sp. VNQ135]|uniref:hypothetical protein n=1 Tax=Phenylobacterium sp. VNQ135 TaxID=3400922 RepID=UPI003BFD9115